MAGFIDGIKSFVNDLANTRNPLNTNTMVNECGLSDSVIRAAFKTGIHNKAIRLKTGHALKNTIKFDSTADREYFEKRLAPHVKKATAGMLAFGRGIIVIHTPNDDDVSKPLRSVDPKRVKFDSFYGDMVSVSNVDMSLASPTYFKPLEYIIRGMAFHHSRVIDFSYIEPSEYEAADYRYGGISETELVYKQLLNDGIIERASATIVEKASTFIYKIAGFKDSVRAGKEKHLLEYFSQMENARSLFGAVLIDSEDDANAVQQNISNLQESSDMSLRRLAMVYGIPVAWLVGENVKGLNSTGDNERQIFQDMIEALQSDYLLEPLQKLFHICGLGPLSFNENQGETPLSRASYDKTVLENALLLWQMGEDYGAYLESKGVIEKDDWEDMFDESDSIMAPRQNQSPMAETPTQGSAEDMNVDPKSALNGAQVTAIMEIIQRIRDGKISKATAEKVIVTSFPVSQSEAIELIRDVPEGADKNEESEGGRPQLENRA